MLHAQRLQSEVKATQTDERTASDWIGIVLETCLVVSGVGSMLTISIWAWTLSFSAV